MENKVYFEDDNEEIQEGFKVTDINSANWCLRKMSANEKKLAEYKELAKAEIQRIEAWLQKEKQQIDNSNSYFQSKVEEYFNQEKQKDDKFKISTPYGKVSSKKQQDKWEYDEKVLLPYLKKQGKNEFIRVKEEVEKAKIKKSAKVKNGIAISEEGEIIEGIKVIEQPDKITIKLEG